MTIPSACKITSALFAYANRLQPLWWLFVRLWIAAIFFKSGLTKIEDFDTTLALFAEEYHVPFLPPQLAAISATFVELGMPVCLVFGLGTRPAAFALLVMTAVIQFTYLDHETHYYWAMLLSGLVLHGAGWLSLDYWLHKRMQKHTG